MDDETRDNEELEGDMPENLNEDDLLDSDEEDTEDHESLEALTEEEEEDEEDVDDYGDGDSGM